MKTKSSLKHEEKAPADAKADRLEVLERFSNVAEVAIKQTENDEVREEVIKLKRYLSNRKSELQAA